MSEEKTYRLTKVASELNQSWQRLIEHLDKKGFAVDSSPHAKISQKEYDLLRKDFADSLKLKKEADEIKIGVIYENAPDNAQAQKKKAQQQAKVQKNQTPKKEENATSNPAPNPENPTAQPQTIKGGLGGLKILGKIELPDTKSQSKGNQGNDRREARNQNNRGQNRNHDRNDKATDKNQTGDRNQTRQPENKNNAPNRPPNREPQHLAPKTEQTDKKETVEGKNATTQKPQSHQKDSKQDEQKAHKTSQPSGRESNTNVKNQPSSTQPSTQGNREVKNQNHNADTHQKKAPEPKPTQESNKDLNQETIKAQTQDAISDKMPQHTENTTLEPKMEVIEAKAERLQGLTVLGKIELPSKNAAGKKGNNNRKDKDKKPSNNASKTPSADADKNNADDPNKRKRRRRRRRRSDETAVATTSLGQVIAKPEGAQEKTATDKDAAAPSTAAKTSTDAKAARKKRGKKEQASEKEVQEQIRATLARMGTGGKSKNSRRDIRKERREAHARATEERLQQEAAEASILRVTEFISANEFAGLMDVGVGQIISKCMSLGMMISINERLDASTIELIAEEFGYKVEFITAEENTPLEEEEKDDEVDLEPRAPIVTIMGHVDHGKTTLLDHIRKTRVADGEAGGITQHIGAYSVLTKDKKKITFLDTPGHEAFTAMRARGARVTDIVIIVVAADDGVMPQTKEAINHALNAGVPIIVAINKIDKPSANPNRVKQELADLNILIEEWGGQYQSQEISAKQGLAIDELLDKVALQAELLELKANPKRKASGTVIDASLDKGRGYVTTLLVQNGSLKVGDVILVGAHYGKVRAMTDYKGEKLKAARPSTPVQILGLSGAPQAGDKFNVMESEREAKDIATKRAQILREQSIRARKRPKLDDISRRLSVGNFQQLNLIIKGDVDGSIEAIADSLLKLSTSEVEVRIVHKGVGQISESDVLLATASDAIILAFQVRPSRNARVLAEQEGVEIRQYSVIYKLLDEVKDAIVGLLAPKIEEVIVGTVEIRETFKISKIGTIAGCMVTDGHIKRNSKIRIVRQGVVIHTGDLESLKRYKDDVAEVKQGFECGISIKNFNDIEVGDEIEAFEEKEVKRSFEDLRESEKAKN
ncbi:translation initiation factor IF-2 [Hugenholtzia roseola]|uniref:translation initiation factor IF-2 n=1 Tax=Hugenholtzia roseola TaxID=1002 RepID=UPI00041802D1|nr:translation initiation factor IF-2 [Hugenholtzia roseola]